MLRLGTLCAFIALPILLAVAPPRVDPLPDFASARFGSVRLQHGGVVHSIAFSPEGSRMASASRDQTISIWSVPEGRELLRCLGHEGSVRCVTFSPDGKVLASGGADGVLRVWDSVRGTEIHALRVGCDSMLSLAFSASDGTLAVGGDDGAIRLVDAKKGVVTDEITPGGNLHSLAWSPAGSLLAFPGAKEGVMIWDAQRKRIAATLATQTIYALTFAEKGKTLITWEPEGHLRQWDIATGKQLSESLGSDPVEGICMQIACDDSGRVFAGNAKGGIDVWDTNTNKRTSFAPAHSDRVTVVALAGDVLVSGSQDHSLRFWSAKAGKLLSPREPTSPILDLHVTGDGTQFAVLNAAGKARLYDREGNTQPIAVNAKIRSLALLPKEAMVLIAGGKLGQYRRKTAKFDVREEADPGPLFVSSSADGTRVVSVHQDGSIWLRDEKADRVKICQGAERRVRIVVNTDGSKLAAVGVLAHVPLWDGTTGKSLKSLPGHRGGTLCARFSPDGSWLATGGRDRKVRMWDLKKGEAKPESLVHDSWVSAVSISPKGQLVATGTTRGEIQIWSATSGKLLGELLGHRGPVTGLHFTRESQVLSAGQDALVYQWEIGVVNDEKTMPLRMDEKRADILWREMRQADVDVARLARSKLSRAPKYAMELIKKTLKPVDGRRIRELIDRLDSDQFTERQSAFEELVGYGPFAEGIYQAKIKSGPNLEVQRRLEELIRKGRDETNRGQLRQALGAVELLGEFSTQEAKKKLDELASGATEAALTQAAQAKMKKGRRGGIEPEK
jgi:WD40 repeat protein